MVKVEAGKSFYFLLVANGMLLFGGFTEFQSNKIQIRKASKIKRIAALVILLISIIFISMVFWHFSQVFSASVEDLTIPRGFKVEVYAKLKEPRQMFVSPKTGNVFVGSKENGIVQVVAKKNGKRFVLQVAKNLKRPNGVAMKDGDLYVAEISRILKYQDIEKHVEEALQRKDPNYILNIEPIVWADGFPTDDQHGWKYIKFGPDGRMYVPVGAPCNTCIRKNQNYSTIMRQVSPDSNQFEIFAHGVRNTVGFDWDPIDKILWFSENGRDFYNQTWPPDEINIAKKQGLHFGFPFVYGNRSVDDEIDLPPNFDVEKYEHSVFELESHSAALGIHFYTGKMFPVKFHNSIFVAEHGSWNSKELRGYKVGFAEVSDNRDSIMSYQTFLGGFINLGKQRQYGCGRPVDVVELSDGSLLVSDDYLDQIFRISYSSPI